MRRILNFWNVSWESSAFLRRFERISFSRSFFLSFLSFLSYKLDRMKSKGRFYEEEFLFSHYSLFTM